VGLPKEKKRELKTKGPTPLSTAASKTLFVDVLEKSTREVDKKGSWINRGGGGHAEGRG